MLFRFAAIKVYVTHQIEVITRRSAFRLRKAQDRAHIVEGLIRALDVIDEIIALIRASEDNDTSRAGLMAAPFSFTEVQANHILELPLGRLSRLPQQKLRDEFDELQVTIADLTAILESDERKREVIRTELGEVREKFADDRRTQITIDTGDLSDLDLIEDEEVIVVLTSKGYIKTVAADTFRRQEIGRAHV